MYLPRFAQAGVLRHPHLGTALARSSRVYAVQNQLRQLSLAAKPRFSIRSADGLSRATFQQVRFATDAADGEKKVTKAQARQEETERKRKERASRKEEELTEKLRKAEERVESRKVKAEQREQKQEKENKKREQQKRKKRRDELQELKKAALQRPKYLPQSWYSVAVALKSSELSKSDFPGQDFFTVVHAAVKSFTPEEIEQFKTQAQENRVANQAAFHAWIQSHSPLEILNANIARNMLKRRGVPAMHKLPDDRQVIRARSNYTFFYRDRLDTGDFKHMVLSDAAKQISGEWNKLNEAEKEPYNKLQAEDLERHFREYREVYGQEKPLPKKTPKKTD